MLCQTARMRETYLCKRQKGIIFVMKKRLRRWICIAAAAGVLFSGPVISSADPTTSPGTTTSGTTSAGTSSTGTTSSGTAAAAQKIIVKKVKVKGRPFTLQTVKIKKKAAYVSVGTTDLTMKKDEGYLCFVSPKTRVYSFRLSSFLTKKKGTASVMFQAPDTEEPFFSFLISINSGTKTKESLEFKTKKTSAERRKAILDGKTFGGKTVRMKLKKNQVLYIYIGSDYPKTTARLQIS